MRHSFKFQENSIFYYNYGDRNFNPKNDFFQGEFFYLNNLCFLAF